MWKYCNIIMVHKLVNITQSFKELVSVQYAFLWASGAPNSRASPGSPHSSYATVSMTLFLMFWAHDIASTVCISFKVVSILPPIFWWQQIGLSYCAASWKFGLVAWCNSNKKVSLWCNRCAARSVVVMLHVWYVIAFRFDSHLGNFPFFYFFQNFPFNFPNSSLRC